MATPLEGSLTGIVGADRVAEVEASPALVRALGGCVPALAAAPETPEQVAALLKLAADQHRAVIVYGAELACGAPPQKADFFLDLRRLAPILEHEPGDLTVRAGAGLEFHRLMEKIGKHDQRVALESPAPAATLLDLAMTRSSGPLRHAHGTLRDHVLGVTVATPDGRITRSGGRVVKNVTGYDLMKLHIGSLATLGVVLEMNLRLQPLPERQLAMLVRFEDAARACQLVQAVRLDRELWPAALDVTNDLGLFATVAPGGLAVAVLFEGGEAAVEAQMEAAQAHVTGPVEHHAVDVLAGVECARLLEYLARSRALDVSEQDLLSVRITAPPSRLADLVAAVHSSVLNQRQPRLIGWAGLGIVDVLVHGMLASDAELQDEVTALSEEVVRAGGELHLRAAPPFVWATYKRPVSDGVMALERRLRSALDRSQVLNPGRIPGLP